MNEELRNSLVQFFPEFKDILQVQSTVSDSTWNASLFTGKLLELTSLLFLCKSFKDSGAIITIPDLYQDKPELFYLRNEIPLHHAAQAGHSASLYSEIKLVDRYIAAFTPKVIIEIGGKNFYVMREGNSIHELEQILKYETEYKDRPDIGIYSGKVSVSVNDKIVNVVSINDLAEAYFSLEAKNTSIIPLINYDEKGEYYTKTSGIIECSVKKSTRHANSQIAKYIVIFDNLQNTAINALFINGGKDKSNYPTLNVNMDSLSDSFSSPGIEHKLSKFVESMI